MFQSEYFFGSFTIDPYLGTVVVDPGLQYLIVSDSNGFVVDNITGTVLDDQPIDGPADDLVLFPVEKGELRIGACVLLEDPRQFLVPGH